MKKIGLLTILLFGVTVTLFSQPIPSVEEWTLDNGLKVFFIPYGKLKTTSVALYINFGKKNEAPGQQLYSEIAVQCMSFGNATYSKSQLKEELFKMGTTMNTSVNENYTVVEASFTDRDLDKGMKLMSAAVIQPVFPELEIQQFITQTLDYNNPMKMDIVEQAALYANTWVYGKDNPIGRCYQVAALKKTPVTDIKDFYAFNVTPKNSRLVVCGNYDKEAVKQMIRNHFGSWKAQFGEVNGVSFESPQMKGKEYGFINRKEAEQAALLWNKNGPVPGSKDELPFLMANVIFNNVLFKEIREKGGKTYGISSQYNPYSGSSIYKVLTQVRNEEVVNTIRLFDAALKSFYEKGLSATDLKTARKNLKNNWQMIQSPDEVISFFNPIIYSKPAVRNTYLTVVDAVLLEDVNRVIKKYFTPDNYKLMISGDETALEKQLLELKPMRRFTLKDLEMYTTATGQ